MIKSSLSTLFAVFHAKYLMPYGAGTLMTVFVMVTPAVRAIAQNMVNADSHSDRSCLQGSHLLEPSLHYAASWTVGFFSA